MKNNILKYFILFLSVLVILIVYLSTVGIETDKFNTLIKNKANESHQQVKLEFENTKIYLNLGELNLAVKLQKSL